MKIKLFILLACFTMGTAISQITSRVMIVGKVSAPIGDEVEGVVVYNRSNNKGTITGVGGEFKINAGIGDRIEIVAMQYQNFIILVDKATVNSKRLHVFLNESVNQLEEVVITPYDLTGTIAEDIKKMPYAQSGFEKIRKDTSSKINDSDYDFTPDELSAVQNNAIKENRLINGLDFVNLFKLVYKNKKGNTKKNQTKDIDVIVRDMYNDQFFKDYLALEIHQINDFIYFAESNGLNVEYFKSGKELDLLQFLAYQSKHYKNQEN